MKNNHDIEQPLTVFQTILGLFFFGLFGVIIGLAFNAAGALKFAFMSGDFNNIKVALNILSFGAVCAVLSYIAGITRSHFIKIQMMEQKKTIDQLRRRLAEFEGVQNGQ